MNTSGTTAAAMAALSHQIARASGWPDAATRLEALHDLESIGNCYVDARLRSGRSVESAETIRAVILGALLEQTETTRGPREIPGRLIQLAADASRRCYERAKARLAHLRQRAAAGDATADQLAERILADLREREAARREAQRVKNRQDYVALYGDITTDAAAQQRAEECAAA